MKKAVAALSALALLAAIFWLRNPPAAVQVLARENAPATVNDASVGAVDGKEESVSPHVDSYEAEFPGPVTAAPKPVAIAAVEEPAALHADPGSNDLPPVTALENMRASIRQYALRFGENPVGDNSEITAALTGKNSKQVTFLGDEDGMRLNSKGQLIDHWGTAYFFHQLSRSEMEIRSAGPDRRLWTADDLVLK